MRIILTRPKDRAAPLKEKLEGLGFEILLAPLLTISNQKIEIPEAPLQGIIFTSVQGVEAVRDEEAFKFFPVFAVGTKTAGAAAAAGFKTIHNAEGDSEALFDLLLATCKTGKGLLLHLAGEQTTGNIVPRLKERGFEAQYKMVYRAVAADSLPANIKEKMAKNQIDAVAFFSARTAMIFNSLLAGQDLKERLGKMQAFCLSENIADEVRKLGWQKIHIAAEPTEASLIELLQARLK